MDRLTEIVDGLCECAMAWGWQRDQGHDDAVINSVKRRYLHARRLVEERIKELEAKNVELEQRLAALKGRVG